MMDHIYSTGVNLSNSRRYQEIHLTLSHTQRRIQRNNPPPTRKQHYKYRIQVKIIKREYNTHQHTNTTFGTTGDSTTATKDLTT